MSTARNTAPIRSVTFISIGTVQTMTPGIFEVFLNTEALSTLRMVKSKKINPRKYLRVFLIIV